MKKAYCIFLLSVLFNETYAQNVSTINNNGVSSKEFLWAYKKSHNGNSSASYNELLSYLEQYINFKLKVLDAKKIGLDKISLYKDEIKKFETLLRAHRKNANNKTNFNFLLNEYKDGVLMFNVSEMKVWNKAQEDENALIDYYSKHKEKYTLPLSEIKGKVISDFQIELENQWITQLKSKYTVKINEQELNKLAKP